MSLSNGVTFCQTDFIGEIGVSPRLVRINTTDALATIVVANYLQPQQKEGFVFVTSDMFAINYSGGQGWFTPSITNGVITLSQDSGGVNLPTIASHIAVFTDTNGTIGEDAATAINGGNIQAGLSGTAGTVASFPATALKGSLKLIGVANTGDTVTAISNDAMGQASVVSIPDPGAATAKFLLDTGAANILAQQQFVGINSVLTFGTGTWTVTRVAQGNYVSRHTAGDETSIIAVDITPAIRVAAAKGFRLDSFDYIYSIGTLAMDAHTAVLDRIAYANNVAVSVTSVPITATLATATQANPYVTNCTVTTPAFDITADSKYVLEITANNAATTAFDFYGIMLRFSQTVG